MFSWKPPKPHLKNGVIVSYNLTCIPTPFYPMSPLVDTRNVTISGFLPSTTYNCSVKAINSGGTGPPAYVKFTAQDESGK